MNGYSTPKINSSLSSNNMINNNYSIKVDEENLFRKMLKNKYKEDLDNLVLQRKNSTQNLKNEYDDYFSKIQRMNDKYKLEKISNQMIFREYNSFNEKEAEKKRQKYKELKENQTQEYLREINKINIQNELSRKINQEKKEKLRLQLEKDLIDYRKRKFDEKQKEKRESEEFIIKEINNDIFLDSEKRYRSKISRMNNNIYKNALLYNDYLNKGKNSDLFSSKNDLIFNQKVAEMKQKEKQEKLLQSMDNIKLQSQNNLLRNLYEQQVKEQKLLDQKDYRDFLDKQMIEHKKNKSNNNILLSSGEQLLMPSYRYSNVPKPLINYTFGRNKSVANSIKNEEETNKKFYLGDSNLKHNPITCPVEDLSPRKYILSQIYKEQNRRFKSSNNQFE